MVDTMTRGATKTKDFFPTLSSSLAAPMEPVAAPTPTTVVLMVTAQPRRRVVVVAAAHVEVRRRRGVRGPGTVEVARE